MKHLFNAGLVLALTACASVSEGHAQDVGVEVWIHGSDIETPRHTATRALRDSIENAIEDEIGLVVASFNTGNIRITMPEDVIIANSGGAIYILFDANISTNEGGYESEISGYCEYQNLNGCTTKFIMAIRSAESISP